MNIASANIKRKERIIINSGELSERKKMILKAIIEAHIAGGEPVGSKFLTADTRIRCSSATIRNEMAELEELGFLEQPHTSAGRIPSELGYRFYVDSLVDSYSFTQSEIEELENTLARKRNELDSIMQTAVSLAAKLTNYTALSIKPRSPRITVGRFEIMRLDETTSVLIMLIGSMVKTKYIRSSRPINSDTAALLAAVLNARATGITAKEMNMPLIIEMEKMMGEYDYLITPVVRAICETISGIDGGEIRFEGINRLLSYPEVYDIDRLREMLALFEKKDTLLQILSDEANSDDGNKNGMRIYIGRENLVKVMDNSTLIFKSITENGVPVGAIGVIGPTRMNYSRVIATIDGLTKSVSDALSLSDGDDKT